MKENGFPFVGYKKIQGVPLANELFMSLEGDLKERVVKQIADFVRQMRSFPLDIAKRNARVVDFSLICCISMRTMKRSF